MCVRSHELARLAHNVAHFARELATSLIAKPNVASIMFTYEPCDPPPYVNTRILINVDNKQTKTKSDLSSHTRRGDNSLNITIETMLDID